MAKTSEIKKIIRACKKQGLVVPDKMDGKGHYRVYNAGVTFEPNGKPIAPEGGSITCVPVIGSPRRDDAVRNQIARLRRELGFTWNGH